MPDPIASSTVNMSVYDPSTEALACSGEAGNAVGAVPAALPNVVTIEPVVIEGDASRKLLVDAYDRQVPRCSKEQDAAVWGCTTAAITIGSGLLAAPTGIGGIVAGMAGMAAAGNCHRLMSDYDACQERSQVEQQLVDNCLAREGTPLVGRDEVVCLVSKP